MGKHVPGSNLFPTVRTRRPTGKRVYLSIKRVCLPTSLQIYMPNAYICRPIHRTMTVHLHQTLAPYCYLSSPFYHQDYHAGTTLPPTIDRAAMPTIYKPTPVVPIRLLLQLTVYLYQTLAPYCYLSSPFYHQDYHAGTTLPPTTDCADMPTIYKTTDRAVTPAIHDFR